MALTRVQYSYSHSHRQRHRHSTRWSQSQSNLLLKYNSITSMWIDNMYYVSQYYSTFLLFFTYLLHMICIGNWTCAVGLSTSLFRTLNIGPSCSGTWTFLFWTLDLPVLDFELSCSGPWIHHSLLYSTLLYTYNWSLRLIAISYGTRTITIHPPKSIM